MKRKLAVAMMIICSLTMGARVNAQNHPIYQQAKEELGEPGYTMYRVVDRIARANLLDDTPWRISVDPEYDFNAHATDMNLIVINLGLYDRILGDPSALACVIGHEMAHHTELHIPESVKREVELAQQLENMKKEAQEELVDAQQDSVEAVSIGRMFGSLGGLIGAIAASDRIGDMKKKIAKLEQEYQEAQLQAQEDRKNNEFQADALGFKYMVKAGFEPDGCVRMLKLMNRQAFSLVESESHPSTTSRIDAMNQLMSDTNIESLQSHGDANLQVVRRQPLTYGLGLDGKSIRINSSYGSNDAHSIDNMFDN